MDVAANEGFVLSSIPSRRPVWGLGWCNVLWARFLPFVAAFFPSRPRLYRRWQDLLLVRRVAVQYLGHRPGPVPRNFTLSLRPFRPLRSTSPSLRVVDVVWGGVGSVLGGRGGAFFSDFYGYTHRMLVFEGDAGDTLLAWALRFPNVCFVHDKRSHVFRCCSGPTAARAAPVSSAS